MSWASQSDDAMAAFRAGRYDAAEAAFLENAKCALRQERNLTATVDAARFGTRQQNLDPTVSTAAFQTPTNIPQRTGQTCTQRGFQLYMAGLSQIQLGRPDDAKKSFKKATSLSKTLYDAHYKLGLMALLEGDHKMAERQLAKIESILTRCHACAARQEISDRQAHLQKALNGAVRLY